MSFVCSHLHIIQFEEDPYPIAHADLRQVTKPPCPFNATDDRAREVVEIEPHDLLGLHEALKSWYPGKRSRCNREAMINRGVVVVGGV
jgi:hypothetical protein